MEMPCSSSTIKTYLAFGTNLGDRLTNIRRAILLIERHVGHVLHQSSIFETQAWGYESDNTYLNLCICVATNLSPEALLQQTQMIERQLGRTTKTNDNLDYSDRPIDIDILLYGDQRINEKNLQIPHPRMTQRPFVMIPLNEMMRK